MTTLIFTEDTTEDDLKQLIEQKYKKENSITFSYKSGDYLKFKTLTLLYSRYIRNYKGFITCFEPEVVKDLGYPIELMDRHSILVHKRNFYTEIFNAIVNGLDSNTPKNNQIVSYLMNNKRLAVFNIVIDMVSKDDVDFVSYYTIQSIQVLHYNDTRLLATADAFYEKFGVEGIDSFIKVHYSNITMTASMFLLRLLYINGSNKYANSSLYTYYTKLYLEDHWSEIYKNHFLYSVEKLRSRDVKYNIDNAMLYITQDRYDSQYKVSLLCLLEKLKKKLILTGILI